MSLNGGNSVFNAANDAAIDAVDAHPITPFHNVLRSEGFKHEGRSHTDHGSIGRYGRENEHGGKESVELHHDRGTGKIQSVTKSGAEGQSLSHSVNSSPDKMHRNIHEASYRAPKNMPAAHSAAQVRENRTFLTGAGAGTAAGGAHTTSTSAPKPHLSAPKEG